MSTSQSEPGWYYAQGDPPGTHRYWDGSQWVGQPVAPAAAGSMPGSRRYGGAGIRLGARILDILILLIPLIVLLFAMVDFSDNNLQQSDLFAYTVVSLVVTAAYEIFFTGLRGATLGKSVLGLKVINAETGASPIGVGPAAIRWAIALVGLIPGIGSLISLGIGIASGVMISNDDQNRSVYDRIAKTLVVYK